MSARLVTERTILRSWEERDLEPFARLNADPRVMEFMPRQMTRDQSDRLAARIREHFRQHGFGLWAVENQATREFMGFVGLSIVSFEVPFGPSMEIAWRLAFDFWGRGFATEAAQEAMHYGFNQLGLERIHSFTVPTNRRSRRVMEKLGMQHLAEEDFDHPALPPGHPLQRHVLYQLTDDQWRRRG